MRTKTEKISLKDFTEKYTKIFETSSKEQLSEILKQMARDVDSASRQEFLNKLHNTGKNNKSISVKSTILDKIAKFKEKIIEIGKTEPDWNGYDDEDSLAGYEEFVHPLANLFSQVDDLFNAGHYKIAMEAYKELFSIFEIEDDYGRGIRVYNIEHSDLDEARARYFRSIYLTEESTKRIKTLLAIMEKFNDLDFQERPKLNDLISISTESLPEFSMFLTEWINATKEMTKPQYDAWHREATFLLYGVDGMSVLAKKEGDKRPRIYVDWINYLIAEKNYIEAIKVASISLKKIPENNPIKAAISDLMVLCGQKINDKKVVLDGLWFSFEAKPNLLKLAHLYLQCDANDRPSKMHQASTVVEAYLQKPANYNNGERWERDQLETPANPSKSLLLHTYLLSSENNKAFELAKKGKSLGWSSNDNPQPFFIAYYLIILSGKPFDKLPVTLKKFWDYALNISLDSVWYYDNTSDVKSELFQSVESSYQNLLSAQFSTPDPEIIKWGLAAAENRVIDIVSNQHRKAYDRAALLTVACSDALALTNPTKAINFYNKIKNKFPRHPAFQAELNNAKTNIKI
jgi:hypothetical protein